MKTKKTKDDLNKAVNSFSLIKDVSERAAFYFGYGGRTKFSLLALRLVRIYAKLLKLEYSDITTKQLELRKSLYLTNRTIYLGEQLLGESIEHLFEVLDLNASRRLLIEEMGLQDQNEIVKVRREFRDRDLVPHLFEASGLSEILIAIVNRETVEGINISEKIRDPKFRFLTHDNPILSGLMSEALSLTSKDARSVTADIQKKGVAKLKENADDFARKMFTVINKLKEDEKISSFRETVKILNEKKIPSYRGGEWYVNSLQQLQHRWDDLGLNNTERHQP